MTSARPVGSPRTVFAMSRIDFAREMDFATSSRRIIRRKEALLSIGLRLTNHGDVILNFPYLHSAQRFVAQSSDPGKTAVDRLDKPMDAAVANKWTLADIRQDWKVIFPFEQK
jgi:hypothetical protein